MAILKPRSFLILICFFYTVLNYAQNLNKETKPLSEILTTAEKQYKITFTFANKIISKIEIIPYNKRLTLKETIHYFKKNTRLNFTFLSKTNILISKDLSKFSICGYLIDINTKTAIEGVHISVLNTAINTFSNDTGYFIINELNENQVIEIQHISYPTTYLNSTDFSKNNTCLNISLSQKIESLNEVFLMNYLTSGINIKTDNTTTIDVLNSGILPGLIEPDILHKIQALPGISSINETISNINIRGGSNDQNLLLWDGIRMYHSGHFFGLISAFNPYLIDKVTLIKNGTSSQYNDGVSGTIKIESINEIKEQPFGGGGFNFLSTDAYAQIPLSKKMAFQFTGRRAITDLLDTPTFEQYFKKTFQDSKVTTSTILEENTIQTNSSFNFYDYSLKLLYDFHKNHKLRVSFLNVENSLDYSETLISESITEPKTSILKQKNVAFGVQLTNKWNKKFKTFFQAYYTKYNINASNFSLLTEQRLLQNNEVFETGAKFNTYYRYNKNFHFLNGYHFSELGITNAEDVNLPVFIRTIKNVIRNHSLYSELNFVSSNNKTIINSGFRLNYIEKFGTFMAEPRFQALHKVSSNLSVKFSGEFKSQNATQIIDLQEDFLGVEKKRWTLADNNLIPIIKSKQASLGINYKKNTFFIDIEGFYKYVNGITTANQGFQNQNQFIKTSGSYTVKGLEFMVNKKTKVFSTWLGYTFNKNDYKFNELTPSVFPNNLDIRHSISFGNTYTYKRLNIALGLLWRTGKPHTTPIEDNAVLLTGISNSINYNEPNRERLSNYFRADFSSTYNFKLSKKINGLAGVSILNLLNTKNILNTYYKITAENSIEAINNTSIGVTPNITFRVSF